MTKRSVPLEHVHAQREPQPAPVLAVHGIDDAQRAAVETFIGRVYERRFGARITAFAPVLVSLRDPVNGRILAAAGYRTARGAPLFLERYLHAPVHMLLANPADGPPSRDGIFEVGHLAAERAGEGRRLIFLLGPHLAAQGAQWVVSTLTEELRHLFVRLGIAPLALGRADPAVIGPDAAQWGSYYDHRPVVLAGQLRQALRLLARRQPDLEQPV
ncbi:thermostable hemolysin [Hydrogenophaga sp.]|uniref:thermostable hemolysin n=1 Tax=Hydrogenophaga sp. TaxID=1904254 RepID=UPI00272159B2|nr:thermostable hemolysin [Hydrogenophaga sp.]MDO9436769.1 thermostable hemolysin [Hydrogenophaga sp.]